MVISIGDKLKNKEGKDITVTRITFIDCMDINKTNDVETVDSKEHPAALIHYKETVEKVEYADCCTPSDEPEDKIGMDNVNAINTVFYYIYNINFVKDDNGQYYPEVILKANWPCGDLKYIKDKWMQHLRNVDGNETVAILNFYSDIDSRHRRVMTEWILENFDCGYDI